MTNCDQSTRVRCDAADPRARRATSRVLTAVVLLAGMYSSMAWCEPEMGERELALLPEYCRHTITFREKYGSKEAQDMWFQRLGESFRAMHHYCWGLVNLQEAGRASTSAPHRQHLYRSAISNIDYVLERSDESFILRPELLTRRGETQAKLHQLGQAEASFREAFRLRADYWPAYKGLAEVYLQQRKPNLARETLETGLSKVSEKRVLRRMLDELK